MNKSLRNNAIVTHVHHFNYKHIYILLSDKFITLCDVIVKPKLQLSKLGSLWFIIYPFVRIIAKFLGYDIKIFVIAVKR